MRKYKNRYEAGKILAKRLSSYTKNQNVLVLALPRGGVPIAYEVARFLQVPLDVFVVRKLGVPGQSELALGAIASGGITVFNESVIKDYRISTEEIEAVIEKEKKELHRREMTYRGDHSFTNLQNKIIILIDDGMATGATIYAAIKALSLMNLAKLIVAVPVAPQQEAQEMKSLVDEWICPLEVENLHSVGNWYDDFEQTEDNEVYQLLNNIRILSIS
jgi:predicted phosphoribosyltransferase